MPFFTSQSGSMFAKPSDLRTGRNPSAQRNRQCAPPDHHSVKSLASQNAAIEHHAGAPIEPRAAIRIVAVGRFSKGAWNEG
jgi:hypothetical protein